MTKTILTAIVVLLITGVSFAYAAQTANLQDSGVALKGYDPVSYLSNSPTKGKASLTATHNGATYYFANAANRDMFTADPAKYEPAYGGWCAWAMLDGDKVDVDPKSYKIIEGKVYLYYNGFWGNTLEKWNDLAGQKGEDSLVQQADNRWKSL